MIPATKTKIKIIIFTIIDNRLHAYLASSTLSSSEFISGKSLDIVASDRFAAIVKNKTSKPYIEQLYTFLGPSSVTISYYALIPSYHLNGQIFQMFTDMEQIGDDSPGNEIIQYALQRLRWKIEYTNVVYGLLPDEFTLSDLQKIYEAILGKVLDKRNFRKKMLALKLLVPTGKKTKGAKARPAEIYSFQSRSPQMVKIFS